MRRTAFILKLPNQLKRPRVSLCHGTRRLFSAERFEGGKPRISYILVVYIYMYILSWPSFRSTFVTYFGPIHPGYSWRQYITEAAEAGCTLSSSGGKPERER